MASDPHGVPADGVGKMSEGGDPPVLASCGSGADECSATITETTMAEGAVRRKGEPRAVAEEAGAAADVWLRLVVLEEERGPGDDRR